MHAKIIAALITFGTMVALPVHSDALAKTPGTALLSSHPFDTIIGPGPGGTATPITVANEPFTSAIRLETLQQPKNAWDTQIVIPTIVAVKKGDTLFATFWMRVERSMSGYGLTNFVAEDSETFEKSIVYPATSGGLWTRFQVPFTAADDEAAGHLHINFAMGFPAQTIDIGGVSVIDYGTGVAVSSLPRTELGYEGRSLDAPWRKAAARRIDKIRKANVTVRVHDRKGRPISNASVSLKMVQQAFHFGAAVGPRFMDDTPDGRQYRKTMYANFNTAVPSNSLKWAPWDGDWGAGDYGRASALKLVAELRSHGMAVRGHNLVWPSKALLPDDVWALHTNPAAFSKRILDHITDEVTALRGQVYCWDVVNEAYANHDAMDILGPDAMASWYAAAHAADPNAQLFINDYGITENSASDLPHINAYIATIKSLIAQKVPIGGIGLQSHFSGNLTSPHTVYSVLTRFGKLGLPLEITEFDVNTPDLKLQADYWRDYLTVCFSHPDVQGFTVWGFWEGDHWIPQAALYTKDWSARPAAKVWNRLVKHDWWTDVSGRTNSHGNYKTRGFLGTYILTISKGGSTKSVPVNLTHAGAMVTVQLP